MRRFFLLLLLLSLPPQVRAEEADVIVELRGGIRVLAEAQTAVIRGSRALGAKEISALSHLPLLNLRLDADRLDQLAALPGVRAVYPNHRVRAARAEGGALIGSPQLRTRYRARGKGVGVAVFDSGIDASHPELARHVVAGFDFIGNEPFSDRNGHGTAVAGIIHGMAPDAHLFSFKVLDDQGNGTEWSVLEGLNAVYANRDAFVFCCFNNNFKLTPIAFSAWMRILGDVDGSVLWLMEDNALAAANLRKEAHARGVDPGRLVFARRVPLAALDALPHLLEDLGERHAPDRRDDIRELAVQAGVAAGELALEVVELAADAAAPDRLGLLVQGLDELLQVGTQVLP